MVKISPMKKVVIIGGSGRIGSVVAERLLAYDPELRITITGRDAARGQRMAQCLGERVGFVSVELGDASGLQQAISGAALVLHTAGPFQGTEPTVLSAAIACGVPYLDIADDLVFARKARALSAQAAAQGVAALVNGGVFPGMSNVMAGLLAEQAPAEKIAFSYFIAGSGGSGPAVMASTFILGTTPATEFVNGQRVERTAFTGGRTVSFLAPIGARSVYYLELPEVTSCFETYRIPSVVARFGTSPGLWNRATRLVCWLFRPWLGNRKRVASFVALLLPLIRLVDRWVGAAIGMEVEAVDQSGKSKRLRYVHTDTLASIAAAVTAQADELLRGRIASGVHWPEEAITDKPRHLELAAQGGLLIHD